MNATTTLSSNGILTTGALIAKLNANIDRPLSEVIPSGVECAVLDFPDYSNPGDSAIWLGQKAWLERNGNPVVYVADRNDYNPDALRESIGSGFILINGGGNFGDLWPDHQSFRERVVQDFPDNPIIQMPQSMHYSDQSRIEETARIFNGHRRLHLLWRDRESLETAQRHFNASHSLCPDMAFVLGRIMSDKIPGYSMVWLSRTDKESGGSQVPSNLDGILVTDWIKEPETELMRRKGALSSMMREKGFEGYDVLAEYMNVCDRLAWERTLGGARILRSGRMVMTDRLHAHIFSLLLDIPHIILDNSYGKLSRFHRLWTSDCRICLAIGDASHATSENLAYSGFHEVLQEYGLGNEEFQESFGMLARGVESSRKEAKEWEENVRMTVDRIDSMLPQGSNFLLIDDEIFRHHLSARRQPFCKVFSKGGSEYMGPPEDDREAMEIIQEFTGSGIRYTVFCQPSFWWMEHYPALERRIDASTRLVHASDLLRIYETIDDAADI